MNKRRKRVTAHTKRTNKRARKLRKKATSGKKPKTNAHGTSEKGNISPATHKQAHTESQKRGNGAQQTHTETYNERISSKRTLTQLAAAHREHWKEKQIQCTTFLTSMALLHSSIASLETTKPCKQYRCGYISKPML